jgi:hypothetical protein
MPPVVRIINGPTLLRWLTDAEYLRLQPFQLANRDRGEADLPPAARDAAATASPLPGYAGQLDAIAIVEPETQRAGSDIAAPLLRVPEFDFEAA